MQLQKSKRMLMLSLLPALIWVLMACSSQDEAEAPPAEEQAAATAAKEEPAAEPTAEEAAAATAVVEAAANPPEAIAVVEAATVQEAAQILDLRSLPLPENAEVMGQAEIGDLSYQVPLDIAGAVDLVEPILIEQGWQVDPEQSRLEDTNAARYYSKDGFMVSLSASDSGQGTTMITVLNHGNVDLRALPQMADAELLYQFPNTLGYVSPSEVASVVDFTRAELTTQGWQEYSRPFTSSSQDASSQALDFKQNGLDLSAFISAAPGQGGQTSVQYSVVLLPLDLPQFDEASNLEFDKYDSYLSYTTPADFDTLVAHYRQEMVDLGWAEIPDTAATLPERAALFFVNEPEEMALMLDLMLVDGQTSATLRQFEAQEMALQDTPTASDEIVDTDEDTLAAFQDAGLPDFLIFADAKNMDYLADAGLITYDSASDIETLLDHYLQALVDEGWEESATYSDDTYAQLDYIRGDDYLFIQLDRRFDDEDTFVTVDMSLTPNLMDDTSTMAGVSGALEAEMPPLPSPDTAENLTYDSDFAEITYTSPDDMEQLVAFYRDALPTDGWQENELLTSIDDTVSIMQFEQAGDSIFITMFSDPISEKIEVAVDISGASSLLDSSLVASGSSQADTSGPLTASEEYQDFPIPSNYTLYSASTTPFRLDIETSSPSDVATVLEFYLAELDQLGWQPVSDAALDPDASAKTIMFEGPDGELTLDLKSAGGETLVIITSINPAAAEEEGLLPPPGQVRVVAGNTTTDELTITIDGQSITMAPEEGMEGPEPQLMLDLSPGSYTYVLSDAAGNEIESDTIEFGADQIWGLIAVEDGVLPLQIY